jgi:hypothetical protein
VEGKEKRSRGEVKRLRYGKWKEWEKKGKRKKKRKESMKWEWRREEEEKVRKVGKYGDK